MIAVESREILLDASCVRRPYFRLENWRKQKFAVDPIRSVASSILLNLISGKCVSRRNGEIPILNAFFEFLELKKDDSERRVIIFIYKNGWIVN